MGLISKLFGSADLVKKMSDRLGVDFPGDLDLSPEAAAQRFRNATIRCSACSDQEGCAELLARETHLDHTPDYCMNKQMLESMLRG